MENYRFCWKWKPWKKDDREKHWDVIDVSGNAVWDPTVPRYPIIYPGCDDLPDFTSLQTDEERERKAESKRPGTYSVVVTLESFTNLSDYASGSSPHDSGSRSTSLASSRGGNSILSYCRDLARKDPNVVFVERFLESPTAIPPFPTGYATSARRRTNLPDDIAHLSISISSASSGSYSPESSLSPLSPPVEPLLQHFRQNVVSRLLQPQETSVLGAHSHEALSNAFEVEAANFDPLYNAMCALSAVNLSYHGMSDIVVAIQYYNKALDLSFDPISPMDRISDGSFLRHFILFIWDMCVPLPDEDSWAVHLSHLQSIALSRKQQFGWEPYANILWTICELDVSACLLGHGHCGFVQTLLDHDMLPGVHQLMPDLGDERNMGTLGTKDGQLALQIMLLKQGITIRAAKLAQTAQSFRHEAASCKHPSPGMHARWQATATQLQNELSDFWTRSCPEGLNFGAVLLCPTMSESTIVAFENALLLFNTCIIYLRTSMFPGQRRIPLANQQDIVADTERRVATILACASQQASARHFDRCHTVFAVFIAGIASVQADLKTKAMNVIHAFVGLGLGQNTYRTWLLLEAVYMEQKQTQLYEAGGSMEDVDWLTVARESGNSVFNCGL